MCAMLPRVFSPVVRHAKHLGSSVGMILVLAAPAGAAVPEACGAPAPTEVVTGTFTTAEAGSFVLLPFDVPKGTTAIRAWYCYDQPDAPSSQLPAFAIRHTLDLGFYGPRPRGQQLWTMREFRGWSGSGFFDDITVSPQGYADDPDPAEKPAGATSRGYRPGPIAPGEWAVELGVAAVVGPEQGDSDGSVDWRVELQLEDDPALARPRYRPAPYDRRPRAGGPAWFAGDFHVHTDQSGDAKQNAFARDVFDYAFGEADLDFVQATDHNTDGGWGEWGRVQDAYPGKLIARNEEITTYRGHVNAPGVGRVADYRTGPVLVRDEDDGSLTQLRAARPVSAVFDDVHRSGGIATINHPTIFDSAVPAFAVLCRGCSWEYDDAETDYTKVDAIEVATGPQGLKVDGSPGPNPFTPLALGFYEDALAKAGRPIAAVAGSDSHSGGDSSAADVTGSPVGAPSTMVFARELSERGIADAVAAGHTYVRAFGRGSPELRFEADGGAIMGDTVHAPAATFTAEVVGMAAAAGPLTLVVTRNGEPYATAPAGAPYTFTVAAPAEGADRYGLQVQRGSALEAFATPISLTAAPAAPLTARALTGRRVRVRDRRAVVRCRASGEGLRACAVRVGRLGRGRTAIYRDGTVRVAVRLRKRLRARTRVTLRTTAFGDAGARRVTRRRAVLVPRRDHPQGGPGSRPKG